MKLLSQVTTELSGKDCLYISERHNKLLAYPIHCHAEYELNFAQNACGARRIVGDSVETLGCYDLVLITGKNLEHVWERHQCKSSDSLEITIHFSSDLFSESFLNKTHCHSIKEMFEKAKRGLAFSEETVLKVAPLLKTLSAECRGFYAVLRFMSILYELSLDSKAKVLSSNSFMRIHYLANSARINKVQDYVEEHYMREVRLATVADIAGMTAVSFSRFFKQITGQTFFDYLIAVRLEHASRLLVDSGDSIADICYKCGFNNLSNFNRIFKKNKHHPPKIYRELYRKQKIII